VIGRFGSQPLGRDCGCPEPLALAAALRDPQALLAPQSLRALAIELPALLKQQLVRAPISPPRPTARDPTQLGRSAWSSSATRGA